VVCPNERVGGVSSKAPGRGKYGGKGKFFRKPKTTIALKGDTVRGERKKRRPAMRKKRAGRGVLLQPGRGKQEGGLERKKKFEGTGSEKKKTNPSQKVDRIGLFEKKKDTRRKGEQRERLKRPARRKGMGRRGWVGKKRSTPCRCKKGRRESRYGAQKKQTDEVFLWIPHAKGRRGRGEKIGNVPVRNDRKRFAWKKKKCPDQAQ